MNEILQSMLASFSPQIAIAVVGGMLGGLIGAEERQKRYGKRLTFLLIIAAIVDAGAVADYLTSHHGVKSIFITMAIAIAVGVFSGHLMDALRIASPSLSKRLVNKVGDVAVDKIDDIGDLVSRKKVEVKDE